MERDDRMMQVEVCSRDLGTDVTAEFTLPDYRPEIKRLLRVKAVPLPVDKYVGGNAVELSGAVEFQALYAAADGTLWCVTQREDYRASCPLDGDSDPLPAGGLTCEVRTVAENVSGRVPAPRKLTARCRLRTKVRLLADRSLDEAAPTEDLGTVERLSATVPAARVFIGESAPFSLTDEILSDGREGPVRVICAEGAVFPGEVQAGSGVVNCRGEVCLSLLCVAEREDPPTSEGADDCVPASAPVPYTVLRRVPFAVEVPVEGAEVDCEACAWGTCTEIAVTVEEGRIFCDLTCVVSAKAVRREEVPYTRDLYSTARESEPVFRTLPAARPLACRNANLTVSAAPALSEVGARPDQQVVDADVQVIDLTPEPSKNAAVLTGTARFRVLLRAPDGEYSVADLETPFRYEAPADGTDLPVQSETVVLPVLVRVRTDGDRLLAEAELSVALALRSSGEVSALSEVRVGAPVPAQGAACVICYPAPGDTLWSVAKRYHAPLADLLAKNRLDGLPAADAPTSLSGVKYLIV